MKPQTTFSTIPVRARSAIVLFAVLGLATVIYAAMFMGAFEPVRLLLMLSAAVVGSRAKINLFRGSTLSFLTAVVLLSVIHDGLGPALLVAIVGVTAQTILPSKKVVFHQLAFNAGMISLTVAAASVTYHWLATITPLDSLTSELTATIMSSFVYFLGNSLSVSLIIALTKGISMVQIWMKHFLCSAPSFLIAGLLSLSVMGVMNSHSTILAVLMLAAVAVTYFSSIRLTAAPAQSA
jgi:hypothetical protein